METSTSKATKWKNKRIQGISCSQQVEHLPIFIGVWRNTKRDLCNSANISSFFLSFVHRGARSHTLSACTFFSPQLQAWKGSTPSNIYQRVADHDDTAAIQKGILSGLEKFTQYTIAIVAYNGAGDSPRSDTKLIKTEEGGTFT